MPVRLVAVKDSLETLQMLREALCQAAEVVQSAEAQDVLPGALRQPTRRRVAQLSDGHPSRQQVAPLGLPRRDNTDSINELLYLYEFLQEIKE